MKVKSLITYTLLTCTASITIGVMLFNQKSFNVQTKADQSVPHTITFTYQDISFFEIDEEKFEGIAEVSKETDSGNIFRSSDITIYETYYTNPVKGNAENNYLFKLEHYGYPYFVYDDMSAIYIAFEMNLDIPSSVTANVNITRHYHNGASESDSPETEEFLELLNEENKHYGFGYEYVFDNQYYEYVTIDSIVISYSCSY